MPKLQPNDLIMADRGGTEYKVSGDKVRTLGDTDLILVQRDGVNYSMPAGDLSVGGSIEPEASDVTSDGFLSGTGTKEDPYIMEPVISAPYGDSVTTTAKINVQGNFGDLILWDDNNRSDNEDRFLQPAGAIDESNVWSGYLYFNDSPVSTEDKVFTALLSLGDVYIQWVVTNQFGIEAQIVGIPTLESTTGKNYTNRINEVRARIIPGQPAEEVAQKWVATGRLTLDFDLGKISNVVESTVNLFEYQDLNGPDGRYAGSGYVSNNMPGGSDFIQTSPEGTMDGVTNKDFNSVSWGNNTQALHDKKGEPGGTGYWGDACMFWVTWTRIDEMPFTIETKCTISNPRYPEGDMMTGRAFLMKTKEETSWPQTGLSWWDKDGVQSESQWMDFIRPGNDLTASQWRGSHRPNTFYLRCLRMKGDTSGKYLGKDEPTNTCTLENPPPLFADISRGARVTGSSSGAVGYVMSKNGNDIKLFVYSGKFTSDDNLVGNAEFASTSAWMDMDANGDITNMVNTDPGFTTMVTGLDPDDTQLTLNTITFPSQFSTGKTPDQVMDGTTSIVKYKVFNAAGEYIVDSTTDEVP